MSSEKRKLPHTISQIPRKAITDKEFTCIYCERKFPSKRSLNWHLPHCKKRAVLRTFAVGNTTFHVWLNPRKDHMKALLWMQQDYAHNPILFAGAILYLQRFGIVHKFVTEKQEGANPTAPGVGSNPPTPL